MKWFFPYLKVRLQCPIGHRSVLVAGVAVHVFSVVVSVVVVGSQRIFLYD